jgi:hypothetical protein
MGLLDQMTKEGVAPNSLTFAAVIKVRCIPISRCLLQCVVLAQPLSVLHATSRL